MAAARECTRLLFEAVNEKSVLKFRLVESTYYPFALLNSFIERNEEGETPLVVAMKSRNGSLIDKLVKFLSRNGSDFYNADIDFEHEDWQLMCLQIINSLSNEIPIVEMIEYLIKQDLSESHWMAFIVRKVFITSTSFTRPEKSCGF